MDVRDDAPRLTFVVNHAAFFVSHRLPIALAAIEAGWKVSLITGQAGSDVMEEGSEDLLRSKGIEYHRVAFKASGLNPFVEMLGFVQLLLIVHKSKPDVIHTASPKGGLMGGLVARIMRTKKLVVAVSGLGFLYTGRLNGLMKLMKSLYLLLIRWVYKHPHATVIVQNLNDKRFVQELGVLPDNKIEHIHGSGVPLRRFSNIEPNQSKKVVLLPARMVRDKGVYEFVEAARKLKRLGYDWTFLLVGAADYSNPKSISSRQLDIWEKEGIVEWRGYHKNMMPFYTDAAIVCLPSHGEGLPKCLLEAAAAGRAVVTFDSRGCREAIIPGITGELVKTGDTVALASAIKKLIDSESLRVQYGAAGRELAKERFCLNNVLEKTLELYRD